MPTEYNKKTDREKKELISVIPRNIYSGFSTTGIWLINTEIFQDADNFPSQMLDRPSMSSAAENSGPSNSNLVLNLPATPPRVSEVSFETEDVSNSAENPDNNAPDLAISEQNQLFCAHILHLIHNWSIYIT
ncbi:unnamed protein product [Euphydryas editha]|uniref:Uncharacterized protein n=1 Tax=Euphydryas editha TaxID=104508 RepID=A0AAU9U789_EUPED|nr:unnamed protein product [Euphydryas editha]